MSSRNLRLSPEQRRAAKEIYRIISRWIDSADFGTIAPEAAQRKLVQEINSIDHLKVEYLEFSQAENLTPVDR